MRWRDTMHFGLSGRFRGSCLTVYLGDTSDQFHRRAPCRNEVVAAVHAQGLMPHEQSRPSATVHSGSHPTSIVSHGGARKIRCRKNKACLMPVKIPKSLAILGPS